MKSIKFIIFFFIILILAGAYLFSQEEAFFNDNLLKTFTFRNLGPFRSGAWITCIAVPESPPQAHLYTFYVGTRHGGLWKTTNNGTTFKPIFDEQGSLSIGAVAVAPSNPNLIWVGTGEQANARSSHAGDGVYKSEDGGQSWKQMGLRDSHHIARIVIHPQNPNIVYVAAMGHLFSFNEERGVFKTEDGGQTWQKVLYLNNKIGAIDLVINRKNPDILYAAMYEKYRYPWHFEEGGPGSGIYKTMDGGKSWQRLQGGLPTGKIGRIGLDIYRQNPDILYAIIENANTRPPTEEEIKKDKSKGLKPQPRQIGGEVYRSQDGGQSWTKMNSLKDNLGGKAAYSFNQIRIDPQNERKIYVTGICLANSEDGGKTWHDVNWPPRRLFRTAFGDVRTVWIDPQDSNRIIMGSDGGFYVSYDGGRSCDYYDNLPIGEIYALGVDMEEPYNIYVGLQDHESWKGPSNGWSGRITLSDWKTVGAQDGMYNQVDPTNSRWLYNTYQFGGHFRVDQKLGTRTSIQPKRKEGKTPYRFNWTPPLLISPHNSQIIYTGAQVLLRSLNRGDIWQEISPDLTTNDAQKIAGRGHITYCTITTISESPLEAGILWVGTDDGKVWVSKDFGANWKDLTPALAQAGAPENYWVSRVFASHHNQATAYVAKTGFRRDDFRPFLYKTTDFGQSWISLASNLPQEPINVIFEDKENPNLLFVGTDGGLYVSLDGGQKWLKMQNNMPCSVIVSDLLIHPKAKDLVVATYGRGVYLTDISPLQELTPEVLQKEVYLFKIKPQAQLQAHTFGGNYHLYGDRHLYTPNLANSVAIYYYLKKDISEKVTIRVTTLQGELIGKLKGTSKAGINKVVWDMRREPP
ncbi:MAG: WD40/YVTN/BNR-like repeat-containing protein, partial [Candidatus Aminicenantales bacterium]